MSTKLAALAISNPLCESGTLASPLLAHKLRRAFFFIGLDEISPFCFSDTMSKLIIV